VDVQSQLSHFGLRAFVAGVIFSGIVGGLFGAFTELARTNDFVLEYRHWIIAGIYLVGAVLAIVVFLLSRPNAPPKNENPPESH
jgi:hypothetical protein